MLYIVTALKSEAQAFVEKYNLIKKVYDGYTLFENEHIRVIVAGVGTECAKKATNLLLNRFYAHKRDCIVNVGICAADEKYAIGTLLSIGTIIYKKKVYIFKKNAPNTIQCVDTEVSQKLHTLADMESFGFYEALKGRENCHIFKVVSDHFEPSRVTKEETKRLISNTIDRIIKEVRK